MEFWGVEVKAGESLKVKTDSGKLLHLSQASLGEAKKEKANEFILVSVKIDDKKIVLGTLSPESIPQLSFDLVFEKEFELSHNWKNGVVYFCGYTSIVPDESEFSDFDDEFEGGLLPVIDNKPKVPAVKADAAKPESSAKPKVKLVEPKKDDDENDDSDDDDDDEGDSEDDQSDDEEMLDGEDSSDEDEDEEDEDEETPKKAEPSKKRASESATKTPVPSKKAKVASTPKTDGKKGGHTATPHPAKKASANGDKSKTPTPKSGNQVSCKSCSKTFNSEVALQSHSKAKHGGGK